MADKTEGYSSPQRSSQLPGVHLLLLLSLPAQGLGDRGSAHRQWAKKQSFPSTKACICVDLLIQVDTICQRMMEGWHRNFTFMLCGKKEAEARKGMVFLSWKATQNKKISRRPTSFTYFVFEVSPLSTDLSPLWLADHPVMLTFSRKSQELLDDFLHGNKICSKQK